MKRIIITIILLICFAQIIFARCENENCGLAIRGKVTKLKVEREQREYIYFDVGLAIEFKNEGREPIILFKPEFDKGYWLGGRYLKTTESGKPICSFEAWQSLAGSMKKYRKLGEKLDVAVPPSKYTKILMPGEIWRFTDETILGTVIDRPAKKIGGFEIDDGFTRCISWKEMQSLPDKLWVEVVYELNPWNVGYFKPNLIENLKERWKEFGNVLVEENKENRFDNFKITSKPIPIDFSEVRGKWRD